MQLSANRIDPVQAQRALQVILMYFTVYRCMLKGKGQKRTVCRLVFTMNTAEQRIHVALARSTNVNSNKPHLHKNT